MTSALAETAGDAGWKAELQLGFARRGARTVLASRHQEGPLLVQRPFYPESNVACHTYLLHPPAGIVGGDELRVALNLDEGAHALVTTPAATRWHFSRGREARVTQSATLREGATLEWLPQETLLFDGTHARLATRINLSPGARFCGWEILGFGRPTCGEAFTSGRVDFRFELLRGGRPLLLERMRLEGQGDLGVPGLRGFNACATLIATGATPKAVAEVRDVLATASDLVCGATCLGDVLVLRGLAVCCEPLLRTLAAVWTTLRPSVLGVTAEPPRIWRT